MSFLEKSIVTKLICIFQYVTKPKISVQLEESVSKCIADNEKPRKHPGIMKIRNVEVPVSVINAMVLILKGWFIFLSIHKFVIIKYSTFIKNCIVLKGWLLLPNTLRCFSDLLCSPKFRFHKEYKLIERKKSPYGIVW